MGLKIILKEEHFIVCNFLAANILCRSVAVIDALTQGCPTISGSLGFSMPPADQSLWFSDLYYYNGPLMESFWKSNVTCRPKMLGRPWSEGQGNRNLKRPFITMDTKANFPKPNILHDS